MRLLTAAAIVMALSTSSWAQQPPAQTQPPSDPTKAAHVKSTDVSAVLAKLAKDKNAEQAILRTGAYTVIIQQRPQVPQAPLIHTKQAELFYVMDGSATMVTGGKMIDPVPNRDNIGGKGIDGGTTQRLSKGDFLLVPAGVPHWFSEIQGSITLMQLYLPVTP